MKYFGAWARLGAALWLAAFAAAFFMIALTSPTSSAADEEWSEAQELAEIRQMIAENGWQ